MPAVNKIINKKYINTIEQSKPQRLNLSFPFFVILISKVLRILSDSQNSSLFDFIKKWEIMEVQLTPRLRDGMQK